MEKENTRARALSPMPMPESSLKSKRKITSSASASNLSCFLRERSSSGDLATLGEAAAGAGASKRRVCVLLTGGTMAMRARKDGTLAPSPGFLAAQMRAMPELREARMPECVCLDARATTRARRRARAAPSSLSRYRARALTRARRASQVRRD